MLGSIRETPSRGPFLTVALLKRDLIERVYIPKGPLYPNSYPKQFIPGFASEGPEAATQIRRLRVLGLSFSGFRVLGFRV